MAVGVERREQVREMEEVEGRAWPLAGQVGTNRRALPGPDGAAARSGGDGSMS